MSNGKPLTVRELKAALDDVDDDSLVMIRYSTPGSDIPFRDMAHNTETKTDPGTLEMYSELYGPSVKGLFILDGVLGNPGKHADGEKIELYSS